ncbi:hypothetical protein QQS21_005342 [Conoideocrella luteorostrata]|uniref:Uncharacterized protein n=1 Tax=Conoideocrella luteorostrata TaxID=1105319 RepID=A0AAJ0CPN8_9HYPO|nr:hypothetical protein QQS21_005342 [Conoideocrella luteorostrata]
MHAIGRCFKRLENIAPDHETLVKKWTHHRIHGMRIRFTTLPDLDTQIGGRFADGDGLCHSARILQDCRTLEEYRTIIPQAGCRQNPHEFIEPPMLSYASIHDGKVTVNNHPGDFERNDLVLDKMQESMRQLLVSCRGVAAIELSERDEHISEPLLPHLQHLLADTSRPIPIDYVFGMEMLLSSYKHFIWVNGVQNKSNCRIVALKFAKDVQKAMLAVTSALDVKNEPPKAFMHLLLLQQEQLGTYTRERRFDLYYQAPWTAGCHMVELLDCAFATGLSLCTDFGYVCVILHLYNALRRIDPPLQNIDFMEDLCQVFLVPLFSGELPRDNFSSNFRRAMGARLEKVDDSSHRRTRKFARPSTTSQRKTPPSSMSLFMELHGSYYRPTGAFWARISFGQQVRQPTLEQISSSVEEVHSKVFPAALEKMKNAILTEFCGKLPTMRINYFSIFMFCRHLLHHLGKRMHAQEKPNATLPGPTAQVGYRYADVMLEDIVMHLHDPGLSRLMKYWRQLKIVRSVFEDFATGSKLAEHLWDI